MDSIVDVRNLRKSFGDVKAVNDISYTVAPGDVIGIVGPDGAGKTTMMRLLCGLTRPDEGEIDVIGFRMPKQRKFAHAKMGYMPQQYSLYGDLSVQENLRFFAGMYGVGSKETIEREKRLLEIARLDRFRDRQAKALSGGMYKKLALSCALVHQPSLLLLDEPTNGVDPISRRELWAFLYELVGDGVTVIVSTPYMDEAERCTRVGLLLDGKLVVMDTPTRLKETFDNTVFELETERMIDSGDFDLADSGISQIYLVGRKTHVITAHGPEFKEPLVKLLESRNIRVSSVKTVAASFEDIFMYWSNTGKEKSDSNE